MSKNIVMSCHAVTMKSRTDIKALYGLRCVNQDHETQKVSIKREERCSRSCCSILLASVLKNICIFGILCFVGG